MITLECLLEFETNENRDTVLDLMRKFSSAMKYAYQRLLDSEKRKDLKKNISKLFNINTRYSDDTIFSAQSMISSCKERGQNPKKLIFGSRALFNKLNKKHLTGKSRDNLISKWREKRQGNLYSRGDKSKQGNLNLRLELSEKDMHLRINTGNKQYVYAKIIRTVNRKNDKWIDLMLSYLLKRNYHLLQLKEIMVL